VIATPDLPIIYLTEPRDVLSYRFQVVLTVREGKSGIHSLNQSNRVGANHDAPRRTSTLVRVTPAADQAASDSPGKFCTSAVMVLWWSITTCPIYRTLRLTGPGDRGYLLL